MSPIPTDPSKQVTTDRLKLEHKCTFVQEQIMKTVGEARNLVLSLGALANALKAKPGEEMEVTTIEITMVPVEHGKATTFCQKCRQTCHKVCTTFRDTDRHRCWAMRNGRCRVCKDKCSWEYHSNTTFYLEPVETKQSVIPDEVIKNWNSHNNSMEGSPIKAMDMYAGLQNKLLEDIIDLWELTQQLTKTALRHSPDAILIYVETLIQTARAQGLPAQYIVELMTAKNTLMLAATIKNQGATEVMRVPTAVAAVMKDLRVELERRMNLSANDRLDEEKKPCSLYNDLRRRLPENLRTKAPSKLKLHKSWLKQWFTSDTDVTYAENLVAIVDLVKVLLSDGSGVVGLAIEHQLAENEK